MAIASSSAPKTLLTYEEYMAEDELCQRYDIIDGERIFMTNPTRRHQKIQLRIANVFLRFEEQAGRGEVITAPCDILITRSPLRTRQPDVIFISNERLALNPGLDDPAPMEHAPELVVEIVSPSESNRALDSKIVDYYTVGVRECWVAYPGSRTVEVLRLHDTGFDVVFTFAMGETVRSLSFPGLTVSVDAIFAE